MCQRFSHLTLILLVINIYLLIGIFFTKLTCVYFPARMKEQLEYPEMQESSKNESSNSVFQKCLKMLNY